MSSPRFALVAFVLLPSCGGGGGGLPGSAAGPMLSGYAMPSCGPADGPAVEVYLTGDLPALSDPRQWLDSVAMISVAPPDTSALTDAELGGDAVLRILVWRGADRLRGERFELAEEPATWGDVSVCRAASGCMRIETGSIEFGARENGALTGRYELGVGGAVRAGDFRAAWVERTVMCG